MCETSPFLQFGSSEKNRENIVVKFARANRESKIINISSSQKVRENYMKNKVEKFRENNVKKIWNIAKIVAKIVPKSMVKSDFLKFLFTKRRLIDIMIFTKIICLQFYIDLNFAKVGKKFI